MADVKSALRSSHILRHVENGDAGRGGMEMAIAMFLYQCSRAPVVQYN
jgi:hypothetical protein